MKQEIIFHKKNEELSRNPKNSRNHTTCFAEH